MDWQAGSPRLIPDEPSSEEGECRLDVEAVVEGTTRTGGLGWRLTTSAGRREPEAVTRLRSGTRIGAELEAVRRGLDAAARVGCVRILVRVSDENVARLLRGELRAGRFRRAAVVASRLRSSLARFRSVRFVAEPFDDRELHHVVAEALDVGLHRAAERAELRAHAIERIMERARTVELESSEGRWIANHRYRVQLDPMGCECPAWGAHWARAPLAGRRAQRLPCKHIVALALRLGVGIPADLETSARKAPG
jgi:ribonuclease HI